MMVRKYKLYDLYDSVTHGYMCIRSKKWNVFLKFGSDGCECNRLKTNDKMSIIGVDEI